MLAVIPYFFPYLIGFTALAGLYSGGLWTWAGFVFVFGVHPVLDLSFRNSAVSEQRPQHLLANIPLILSTPFMISSIGYGLMLSAEQSPVEFWGSIFSVGSLGGVIGINVAHELIHRRNSGLKLLGYINLISVNFSHWGIEHVYGHHKNVATYSDPATARKNESVYFFWIRNYFMGLWDAIQIDRLRPFCRNRVLILGAIQVAIACALFVFWGPIFFMYWIGVSVIAWLLLMTVDYIEHYGLQREERSPGVYGPVKAIHSWDSASAMTNWALFNLAHHAHHHFSASVPYESLKIKGESSKLPFGYSSMIILALVPPLFFKMMNPLLDKR